MRTLTLISASLTFVLASVQEMSARDTVVKGRVTDISGEPLAAVTVYESGNTSNGTVTDLDGYYSISLPEDGTIVFTCLGFEEVQEPVSKRNTINVSMAEEKLSIDAAEVVSIGYGTVSRRDLTGSVCKVDMGEVMKSNVTNFDQALMGRVAGVVVSTSDGALGEEANITIRGNNSLTQSSAPLYIIDGFPSESSMATSLNSADIESIDILKDASATAIYGARGANGVTPTDAQQSSSASGWLIYSIWGYRPVKPLSQGSILDDYLDELVDSDINSADDYRFNPAKTVRNEYRKTIVDYFSGNGSLSWNFNREDLLKDSRWLKNGKLRLSWGQTGNNRTTTPYDYYAQIETLPGDPDSYDYVFDGQTVSGYYPSNMANDDLKWETTEQWNVGLDLSFFENDRIRITADWYMKNTYDLLLQATMPASSGYTSAMMNIGSMRNTGVELSLETLNINKKNFQWTTSFNIAFNRNKVTALTSGQYSLFTSVSWDQRFNSQYPYVTQVGKPSGLMYGYIYEGTYKESDFINGSTLKDGIPYSSSTGKDNVEPGDPKYTDINGDGIIDDNDRTVIGCGQPLHTGGFGIRP